MKNPLERRGLYIVKDAPVVNFSTLEKSIADGDKTVTLNVLKDAKKNEKISDGEYDELHEKYTERLEFENNRLENELHIDSLTGFSNNVEASLDNLIGELNPEGPELRESTSTIDALALVYMDLDKFKVVNDTYGHPVGDQVLMAFAEKMKSVVKRTDILFRSNRRGDEFAIIFPIKNNRTDEVLEKLFQRLYKKLNDVMVSPGKGIKPIKIRASMGYTILRKGEKATAQELIERADSKMYDDKNRTK